MSDASNEDPLKVLRESTRSHALGALVMAIGMMAVFGYILIDMLVNESEWYAALVNLMELIES